MKTLNTGFFLSKCFCRYFFCTNLYYECVTDRQTLKYMIN
nr:MAG TPA: hypothetical protein [Caudoviricetes sp.]